MSDSLAQKPYAATIPRVTGIISAISSSLIIYLICRSENKLSTIYHRIIFAMSCADVIGSIAMALTTLPMPNEIICEEGEDYLHWDTRLGNIQTCEVQGFCVTFGVFTMYAYNGMLCVYYACAIAFQMKENNIRKCVEPFLHIAALAFGLGNSITALVLDNLNASNIDAWCTITTIRECQVRGVRDMSKAIEVQIFFLFSLILTSFGLIMWRTCKIDGVLASVPRTQSSQQRNNNDSDDENKISQLEDAVSKHQTIKVVTKQALAYVITFLLCLTFPLIRNISDDEDLSIFAAYMQLGLLPLQGFFNFLIFVSHKVYNYKRVYGEDSYCAILRKYFCESDMVEPILFSSLSVVHNDTDKLTVNFNDEVGEGGKMQIIRRGGIYKKSGSSNLCSCAGGRRQSADELSNDIMIDNDSRYSLEDSRKNLTFSGFSFAPSNGDYFNNKSMVANDSKNGLSGFDSIKADSST